VRVQPQMPDRTVYFTNVDPQVVSSSYWDPFDGASYYCSRVVPNDPTTHAVVRPGRYLVAGSGTPVTTDGAPVDNPINTPGAIDRYEAWIGGLDPTMPNSASQPNQPRRAIVLDPKPTAAASVMLRDDVPGNTPLAAAAVRDQANFGVYATPEMTSVAIIDRGPRGYQRFSVSEPALGYPDRTLGSMWNGKYYSDPRGRYEPPLDIPLDNQRWARASFGGKTVIDGQSLFSNITEARWFRGMTPATSAPLKKDSDLRLTLPEADEDNVRTIPGYSWLYLQRLANPLLPWNPLPGHQKHRPTDLVNPYLTVDSMGVNVTGFTGLERAEMRRGQSGIMRYGNDNAFQTFASLQRGRANDLAVPGIDSTFKYSLNFVGRIRQTQGGAHRPRDTDGMLQQTLTAGFRNMQIGPNYKGGAAFAAPGYLGGVSIVRDPHQPGHSQTNVNLWGEEQVGQTDDPTTEPSTSLPRRILGMWLNRGGPDGKGNFGTGGSHYFNSIPDTTLGFLNEPFRRQTPTNETEAKLIPSQPFAWLTWNNRPFANPGEMLQVPTYRSSQLFKVITGVKNPYSNTDKKGQTSEQYRQYVRGGTYPPVLLDQSNPDRWDFRISFPEIVVDGPFGHLLNYFRTENAPLVPYSAPPAPQPLLQLRELVGLSRVLDLISVTSPYVGTETWLSPQAFGNTATAVASSSDPRYGFQPPFNRVASRREPGRVNINTLSFKPVWDGIFHGSAKPDGTGDPKSHLGPDDDEFWPVRRGYDGIDPTTGAPYADSGVRTHPLLLDRNVPSIFANPYRSNSAGDLVPLDQLRRPGSVAAGLLRTLYLPKVSQMGGALNPDTQGPNPTELQPQGVPFCATLAFADFNGDSVLDNPQHKYRDSARNPYFRYSPISRLSSLTTTRSNVFAVWVTIGFFEVEEINSGHTDILARYGGSLAAASSNALFHQVYPDGYLIGKEAGIDTGETVRYREFAIIDRTIPVGFEPGANHNARETIRLQRKIE
jgi:hypothetical protein